MRKAQRKAQSAKRIKIKKKNPFLFIWLFFTLCAMHYALCALCYAQSIPSSELINNAKQYDGKEVVYRGEVVGDIMIRKDYAWLNVNDGYMAIGVWVPKAAAKEFKYTGGYEVKGDMVEVAGTFHRSCPEHGGDLDIHASTVTKIAQGETVSSSIDIKKIQIAFFLSVAVLLTCILNLIFSKHKKS